MKLRKLLLTGMTLLFSGLSVFALETAPGNDLGAVLEVQKYYRALHVMVMLLAGFGFLMVFVRRYGRSALTATYLLVSVALPLYFFKDSLGILGGSAGDMDRLILAEFAAASLLIGAGAVLGRLKMYQYLVLALLFVPAYAFNEWLLLKGGIGHDHPRIVFG